MEKIIKIVLILFFSAVLLLPLIFINHDPNAISVIENKKVASFPNLKNKSLLERSTISELETYFDENIGFRKEAVLANISIMYKLFGKIEVPDYLEGSDGHLFYCPENIMESYQGTNQISDKMVEEITASFAALNDELEEKGTDFYFFPIPNKESIYPEYMPSSIKRINDESAFYQVVFSVENKTELRVADTLNALVNQKSSGKLLYYKNYDPTHWNFYGAYIGYKALMDKICKDHTEVVSVTLENSDFFCEEICSPIAYLSQYNEFVETFSSYSDVFYTINYPFKGVSDNNLPAGFSMANDITNSYFHYSNDSLSYSKSIIIIGDSYIYSFMLPLFAESFSDVYFLSFSNTSNAAANELINMVSPDIIVYECVERMFNYGECINKLNDLSAELDQSMRVDNLSSLELYDSEAVLRFDDSSVFETASINIAGIESDNLLLTGWAVDPNADLPVSDVYVEAGGNIYFAKKCQRLDLPSQYLDSGYAVTIPVNVLQNVDSIQVCCLSSDGTAVFKPFVITVIK